MRTRRRFKYATLGLLLLIAAPAQRPDKLKFRNPSGTTEFSIKIKEDGTKLVDASENELARLRLEPNGKVKIKNPNDAVLGYITSGEGKWSIKDAKQEKVLFVLKRLETGDYKFEDGSGQALYRIIKRDDGFELKEGETTVRKVKVKGNKTAVRDANDKVMLWTDDQTNPLAAVSFALDKLTLPQRAGLWLAITETLTAVEK